ncbi:hypothetical protein A7X67_01520 [Clostridium sp. W14A]|nr:hypothetical protein A7X67_01520 [Clostridium sp. W14A]
MLILLFLTIFFAFYFLFGELFHVPTLASTRTVLKLTRQKQTKGFNAVIFQMSSALARHIRLNSYKKRTMTAALHYAGIEMSPETYYATSIVKTCITLLPAVLCIFVFPMGIPVFSILAIKQFMDGTKQADKIVTKKREMIEGSLANFAATIANELRSTRNVLAILEGYRNSAKEPFKSELEITIAEMKSGSQEQALNRLSGRVGSGRLTQVVNGLVGVLQGGDGTMYFTMLAHDFRNIQSNVLEKENMKLPDQLNKYFYLMLFAFIAVEGYIMYMQITTSSGNLF